eukprot:2274469-Pyramimonas_sp.AAC.1
MNARDIVAGTCFRSLAIGNPIADEFAGYAANRVRVPESIRTRVLLHERRAYLIRMRLLRATMDSIAATTEAEK